MYIVCATKVKQDARSNLLAWHRHKATCETLILLVALYCNSSHGVSKLNVLGLLMARSGTTNRTFAPQKEQMCLNMWTWAHVSLWKKSPFSNFRSITRKRPRSQVHIIICLFVWLSPVFWSLRVTWELETQESNPKKIALVVAPQVARTGRTLRGRTLQGDALGTFWKPPSRKPLLRTLLRTLFTVKPIARPPFGNPSENPSPELSREPSQNPS